MITINVVCVGNLKESFSREEQEEYAKRLSAFCKLNIIEIKEQNQLENVDLILEKEGKDILSKIKGYVILCDIKSKEYSSENFAQKLSNLALETSTISFVVGGSYGVSQKVKDACNEKISFSPMTFPHNLFRIMLLEQVYRAFAINAGKTYHK
jgi:23S rRNA (pseudouridine1915-N3)-methyltransferase